jgi:hypothetical protein
MPELLPVTYAKLRAEIGRELGGNNVLTSIVVGSDNVSVLVDDAGELSRATAADNEPMWRAALRDANERGIGEAEVAGWGGESRAGTGSTAIVLRASERASEDLAAGNRFESDFEKLARSQGDLARAALERIRADGGGSTPAQ